MTSLRQAFMLDGGGVVSIVGAGGKTSLMYQLAHEFANAGDRVLTTTTTKIFRPTPDQCACVFLSDSVEAALKQSETLLKDHQHITAVVGKTSVPKKMIGFAPEEIDQIWESGLFRWIIVEADGAARLPLKAPAPHEPVFPGCTTWAIGVVGLSAAGQPLTDRVVFRPEIFAQLSGLLPGAPIDEEAIAESLIHPDGIFKDCPPHARRSVFLNQADIAEGTNVGRRIAAALQTRAGTGLSQIVIGQALLMPPVLESHNAKGREGFKS